jgi:L-asparaginase
VFDPYPLAEIIRSGKTESIHYGHAVVLSKQGIKKYYGNPDFQCYTRSIIKPIQAKVSYDFLDKKLENKFLALACASHNSEPEQIEALRQFAQEFEISEKCLQCGFDTKNTQSTLNHNCAGKHLAMLSACKKSNLELSNYLNIDHPIQVAILQEMLNLLNTDPQPKIHTGIDGCSLPTFYLSLKDMAKIFLNLIQNLDYLPIINAMNLYPFLIGGKNQIDSMIMNQAPNKFIAKGGAEGLMMVANLSAQEVLIIKIIDGSSRAKAYITSKLMREIGWLDINISNKLYNARNLEVGSIL